ncbi:MAG: hypothetical protein K2N51_04970 [Lachnospiraceae bacterium]|nr:hypothetical protein [Lachnospiraceae bacterium]
MSVDKLLDNMKSKEDFIFFMRRLLNDNQVNIEEWENRDDRKFIATLFYVGKI